MAYSYTPKIRVTSLLAGPATVYDLSGYSWTTRAVEKDVPVITSHEMLDFSVQQTRYGSRRQVMLDFQFPTSSSANEATLMTILQAAVSDDFLVELSLDSGTTYREALLDGFDSGDMEDKKIGRIYSTVWTVAPLQTGPIAVLGGSW